MHTLGPDAVSDVVLWGATGQAKVLKEALFGTHFRLVALVDNRDVASPFPGVPVLRGEIGLDSWLNHRDCSKGLSAAVAVGGARGRDRLELMEIFRARGLGLLTVAHRAAFVAADAQIGEGCQIMAQAAVCTHAQIGRAHV